MRARLPLTIPLAVAACGGAPSAPPMPSGPPARMVAAAAGPDDVVVAKVAGRPVWGSCVAAQVARGAPDRHAALDQCIGFELLAQQAEARGLATAPEVIEETRRALASRLIELDFERRYRDPDSLRDEVDRQLHRALPTMHEPEFRRSAYARVWIKPGMPAGTEARAKQVVDQIYAALATETGLFKGHLEATAKRIAREAGVEVDVQETAKYYARGALDKAYEASVFSIPEVGRVAPPVRTQYGWEVILLTDVLPEHTYTRDEVVPPIFAAARRHQFRVWTDELARTAGVHIERHPELLAPEAK